jgi:hypothetical protein
MRNCNAKTYTDDEHLRQNDPEQFNSREMAIAED